MNKFEIGDKVICIDNIRDTVKKQEFSLLKKGTVYTIIKLKKAGRISLEGLIQRRQGRLEYPAYYERRFVKYNKINEALYCSEIIEQRREIKYVK